MFTLIKLEIKLVTKKRVIIVNKYQLATCSKFVSGLILSPHWWLSSSTFTPSTNKQTHSAVLNSTRIDAGDGGDDYCWHTAVRILAFVVFLNSVATVRVPVWHQLRSKQSQFRFAFHGPITAFYWSGLYAHSIDGLFIRSHTYNSLDMIKKEIKRQNLIFKKHSMEWPDTIFNIKN